MDVICQQVTAEELLRMPDDGFRYELVWGELRKTTPAGNIHGRIAMRVAWPLARNVEENQLGTVYATETGFKLAHDPDTVRAPGVAFIGQERLEAAGEVEGFWPGAPDLAVEVISPGDSYVEVEEKVFDWLEAGTKMVVTVNPRKRSATVYRSLTDIAVLTNSDVLEGGDIVPDFRLAVREVFA